MTKPRVIASGPMGARELDDGLYAELGYQGLDGLFEPAMVAKGASIATFDGPVRVRPQATYYEPRTFSLYGYLIGCNGQAEAEQTSHDFFQALSGPNTRFHVGSLYLDCNVTAKPRYDRFRDFTTRRDYRLECEAIPALWGSEYHQSVGGDQGIYVRDDRLDHTSIKMTDVTANGRVVQFTYGGSAPARCALMISGLTSGTTYYIVNPYDGRAVAFTPSAAVHYIPASAGPWLYPANAGANVLRLQSDTSGTLVASGTYLWALVPSAFVTRFLGNDGNKFTEGPVFSHYRRGVATAITAASGSALTSSGDLAARAASVPVGDWTAAKAGLVLEQAVEQVLFPTDDFSDAAWTKTNGPTTTVNDAVAPDGTTTADKLEDTSGATHQYYSMVKSCGASEQWTGSLLVKKDAVTTRFAAIELIAPGSGYAWLNTQTGASQQTGAMSGTVRVYDCGDYWRLCMAVTTGGATITMVVHPALGTTMGAFDPAAVGFIHAWGANLTKTPFPVSAIGATTAAATRNADYCALYRPHNYLKYSRDLTQIATTGTNWIKSNSSISVARNQTAADGTASSNRITWNAVSDYIYQSVTPDCRPNSTPWTLVCAMRLGSMAGANAVALRIEDQAGNLIGSATTVTASDLSASETRTFFATVTAAQVGSDDTGLRGTLQVTTGANSPDIEILGLLKGSFPGAPAHTEGSAIPLPQYGYDWPDWITQNGYVEFDAVLPPISTGLTYYLFGDSTFGLQRHTDSTTGQTVLKLIKTANGGVQTVGNGTSTIACGNVWTGGVFTFKIEWVNYVLAGTQYMYLRLYVDGTLVSVDANLASATVTEWSTPERLLLSGGSVMATVRDITFGVA